VLRHGVAFQTHAQTLEIGPGRRQLNSAFNGLLFHLRIRKLYDYSSADTSTPAWTRIFSTRPSAGAGTQASHLRHQSPVARTSRSI